MTLAPEKKNFQKSNNLEGCSRAVGYQSKEMRGWMKKSRCPISSHTLCKKKEKKCPVAIEIHDQNSGTYINSNNKLTE